MKTILPLFVPFLVLILLSSFLKAQEKAGSAAVREFTGAPTKVVWIEDAGETAAVDSERSTLKLMGLDTEDKKGERDILSELAAYAKPLITADGTRVVFGDKVKKTVSVVNWDGTGLKVLLQNAFFEDVWTDPKDGTEWVYAKTFEQRGENKDVPVIRRYLMKNPAVSELVWDKMPVFMFTVSGDGKSASGGGDGGNSPQGFLTLPNGTFTQRAGGCWPSIAPDDSNRMWVFTGNHRSAHMFIPTNRSGTAYGFTMRFDEAPGLVLQNREEIHRIRWSNNTRFMVCSSPFSEWAYKSDVKIPNNVAEKIEIYIGKFSEDLKTMERWQQVTSNKRGDYWADVWVKPGEGAQALALKLPSAAEEPAPVVDDKKGLAYIWETGTDSNQIDDAETGSIRQCIGQFRDAARFGPYSSMDLGDGAFIPQDADAPVLKSIKSANRFSFEAIITPLGNAPAEGSAIAAFASDWKDGNFILGQEADWLTLRLKTESSPEKPFASALRIGRLQLNKPNHVVISYSPGDLACFINGKKVVMENPYSGGLANWSEQQLVFGDVANRGHNWRGLMEGIRILNRNTGGAEARQRYASQMEKRASRKVAERIVVEAKLIGRCPAADPAGIAPYRRCFSQQQFEVTKVLEGKCDEKKISVAQWSVLDAKVLPSYQKMTVGQSMNLILNRWADRPEQESERMIMGDGVEEGELFYEEREFAPVTASAETSPAWQDDKANKSRKVLASALAVRNEDKPKAFDSGAGIELDSSGQSILLEAPSLSEILVTSSLKLSGKDKVASATVLRGGYGYTASPKVLFSGGGGKGASATALMSIEELQMTKLGAGYTSAPDVTISEPDTAGGRQAKATVRIDEQSKALKDVQVVDPGTGYLRPPVITLKGGGGDGAELTATLLVSEVIVTNGGTGYQTTPQIKLEGGGGSEAFAMAALQQTTLRYTEAGGNAWLLNKGSIEQSGSSLFFDWAASGNASGKRGFLNEGTWTLKDGSVIYFGSSTGRPNWGGSTGNQGKMQVLDRSCIGLPQFLNSGELTVGRGARLGQAEYARGDMTLTNTGKLEIKDSSAEEPAIFGGIHPDRCGSRALLNGSEKGDAKASCLIADSATFQIEGGSVKFSNFTGSSLELKAGATLALLTNDNGSRHRFEKRDAMVANFGDFTWNGKLQLKGNHAGFAGVENRGTLIIQGNKVEIERLENSSGPGSIYKAWNYATRILNGEGGVLQGNGQLGYVNSTAAEETSYLWLLNIGEITPGPGKWTIDKANVVFGNVPLSEDEQRKKASPRTGTGVLKILVGGPASAKDSSGSLEVTGSGECGKFILEGNTNLLNIVPAQGARPTGTYRIVSASEVTGTFAKLQYQGSDQVPYKVNYLPNAIEVVFP